MNNKEILKLLEELRIDTLNVSKEVNEKLKMFVDVLDKTATKLNEKNEVLQANKKNVESEEKSSPRIK